MQWEGISSTGFTHFRFIETSSYSDNGVTLLSFMNTFQQPVHFTSGSSVTNLETGGSCTPTISPNPVAKGEFFTVETDCIPAGQSGGRLDVKIAYSTSVGGVSLTKIEEGIIYIRQPSSQPASASTTSIVTPTTTTTTLLSSTTTTTPSTATSTTASTSTATSTTASTSTSTATATTATSSSTETSIESSCTSTTSTSSSTTSTSSSTSIGPPTPCP